MFRNNVQHLSLRFRNNSREFLITSIYARFDALERLELWEELEGIAEEYSIPWLVGGDFNVIMNAEEK